MIRIPLIPGVTDTPDNYQEIARRIQNFPNLLRIDLLPYHRLAGAKYSQVGLEYAPGFDENLEPRIDGSTFDEMEIPWRVV